MLWAPELDDLVPTAPPSDAAGAPRRVATLTPALELSLPPPRSPFVERLRLSAPELEAYWDRVWRELPRAGALHRVLGYPDMTANSTQTPRTAMLLQLAADDAVSYGDDQPVRWYAPRADLGRQRFTRAIVTGEE